MTERHEVARIVHQVNNLLATIEIQAEVAAAVGTPEAFAEALRLIVDAGRRTQQALPSRREPDGGTAGGDADRA